MPKIPSPPTIPGTTPVPFGRVWWRHWLVRLGLRSIVLGVSPIVLYLLYERVAGLEDGQPLNFGVLAFLGLNLGLLLMLAGVVAVLVGRYRARGAGRQY